MAKRVFKVRETVEYLVQVDEGEMMEYAESLGIQGGLDTVVLEAVENGDVEHDGEHYLAVEMSGVEEMDTDIWSWED